MVRSGFFNFSQQADQQEDDEQFPEIILLKKRKDAQEADIPALSRRKPYLFFGREQAGLEIAEELAGRFFSTRSPDAIISFISGTDLFHTWKRDDFRSAFRAGITKLLGELDLLLIDDGLNYGLTRQIGAAVQAEEEHRTYAAKHVQAAPRRPPINYLGFLPLTKVANSDTYIALEREETDYELEIVPTPPGSNSDGFDINRFHSHYVLVDKSREDFSFLRAEVENQLQSEMITRQRYRDTNPDPNEPDWVKGLLSAFVPHVVFLFQGGLGELDRIQTYMVLRTPIIIMDGCGGIADVIAAGIRSGLASYEKPLRAVLTILLIRSFPILRTDGERRASCVETLLQVVQLASSPTKIYYIIDCSRLDTFAALDIPLLEAIINSSGERNMTSDQLVCNFKLCIACNRPNIASGVLLSGLSWTQIPNKLTYGGMIAALIYPGREAFVDLLLQQRFPVRFMTSHVDLLHLFQKAMQKETFLTLIWNDLLQHHESDTMTEKFIIDELNPLIFRLTGVRDYLDLYELSRVALTRDDKELPVDPVIADDNSLNALIVYAVLLNRGELVKVLLRYSIDPIPIIVFVETMYRGIYRSTTNLETRLSFKRLANTFAIMATEILEAGVRESPQQARTFFQRAIPAYNNKTTLEMAFDARNKTFISHHLVQTWLDQFGNGFIRVKGYHQELKMVLSAYLIFPMYFWLTFPREARTAKVGASTADEDYRYEPRSEEEAQQILEQLKGPQHAAADVKYTEFPPLPKMIIAVWRAPIVKFWTWFIIYTMFLILIGVDMMSPACTNLGLDIAVFTVTTLIWLELVLRTFHDSLWRRRTDLHTRPIDLIFQTVFNVLLFLYRIAPYRETHPFAGRVILAFGVMYYFNSVWETFYVFNRNLGPLVRICLFTFKKDLPLWFLMMLPFLISAPVIWQAIITPDYPFSWDAWRQVFFRGMFTFFDAFYGELEYDAGCVRGKEIDWSNFSQPVQADPQDRCWLGDYDDYSCSTISFWGYFFVANYYVFLKLGMMVALAAFYILEMPRASLIWRYYRFQTLFEYYWRSSLPFPLNIIGNLYLIFKYCSTKGTTQVAKMDPELMDLQMDTFIYWKSVAAEYFAAKDRAEMDRALQLKQSVELFAAKSKIQSITGHFTDLEKKLGEVDERNREARKALQETWKDLLLQRQEILPE